MKKGNIKLISFTFILLIILTISNINTYGSRYSFIIEMESDKSGLMQIYYDIGEGLSEEQSIIRNIDKVNEYVEYKIDIPKGKYKYFRFDPLNLSEAKIDIREFYLIDKQTNNTVDLKDKLTPISGISNFEVNSEHNISFIIEKDNNDPIMELKEFNINEQGITKINFKMINFEILVVLFIILLYKYKSNKLYRNVAIFLTIFITLIFRNADSILNPIIYAEDGAWTSQIINDGILSALWNARGDYFVFGNIILLYIPYKINNLIFNYNLSYLPYIISITSYIFYSMSFTYIYNCFSKLIKNKYLKLLFFLCLVFIPTGDTSNEIFGRICNVGYIFPVLLLASIIEFEKNNINIILFNIISFICINTNPIGYPMLLIYIILKFIYKYKKEKLEFRDKDTKNLLVLLIVSIIFSIIIGYRYLINSSVISLNTESLILKNLIEGVFARSIFYPFIFSIYTNLNDVIISIVATIFIIISIYTIKNSSNANKKYIIYTLFTLIMYIAFAFYMRPGLTNFISEYKGTFPDRYFFAQNILSLIYIFLILDNIEIGERLCSKIISIIILSIYLINIDYLIEFNNPRMIIKTGSTFSAEVIKLYKENDDLPSYNIPLYPQGWSINLPSKFIESTALNN